MSRFSAITDNPHQRGFSQKTGILITNLGSPDAPTTSAVRRYLREFLSDPRVVEIPRLLWLIILHGIILRIRPAKSAKNYQKIWTEQGAPLITITQAQQQKLQQHLIRLGHQDVIVEMAMRYGNPSIESGLTKLREQGVTKIVVLPLYPQYSGATTGSTFDAVSRVLRSWRWVPELHFINGYHQQPDYIEALANSIAEDLTANGTPDKLVFSYHGTPKQFLNWGDPYYCFCMQTTRLVSERLQLPEGLAVSTFQSRFGKAEWLQPYTDVTLTEFAKQGIDNVAILSPAFSADCLETLEELEEENRETFMHAGGKHYRYIKALNDREDHIAALAKLVIPYLSNKA
ncbi:ferrochelatase [Pseudoalteromonas fenneropenaei]|uniref:Ferrochelatase n=1 Tax=Pseudoalteromonas fenneropenaei TaxID=1737459 RepID=A0ABV7CG91_9GAMM